MSAESSRRAPPALMFLIGTMVSCPFLFLAFALSPLSGTWLRFVIPALPFVALLPLWRWVRDPRPVQRQIATSSLVPEGYAPGA